MAALSTPQPARRARGQLLLATAAVALAVGCASDQLVLPSDGGAAAIEVVQGNGQAATVGSMLKDSLVVQLTDNMDRPVQGERVVFQPVGDNAGVTTPDTVLTDALGRAASRWKLGAEAGSQTVDVHVASSAGSGLSATFQATARPAQATALDKVQGDSQTGQTGTTLADSLVVKVTDDFGNPVSGIEVSWQPSGGSVTPSQVTTGSDGRAAAVWTLGLFPGTQVATASASGLSGSPATFRATASVGPPPTLTMASQPSPNARSGVALDPQPVVQLKRPDGGTLQQAGIRITAAIASGNGTLGGTTAIGTDNQGRAHFSNLAITGPAGPYVLIFAADGFLSVTSETIDLAASTPSGARSTVEAAPASIPAGGGPATITVTARDASGNPVSGMAVTLSATGNGNTLTQPAGLTDNAGKATGTFTSTAAGASSITARVAGVNVTQAASVTVTPGAADAARSSAAVPNGRAGSQTLLTVQTRDRFGNTLTTGGATVVVTVNGANSAVPAVTDQHDGTYTASYTPQQSGDDQVDVRVNGAAVQGSPYTSHVTQSGGGGPDPAHTTAQVPNNIKNFNLATIVIVTADAAGQRLTTGGYASHLDVQISGNNSAHPSIVDKGDGTYEATYLPFFKGNDTATITYDGVQIAGSPYHIKVK